MDMEKIRLEAKKIMDEFVAALDRIPEAKEEFGIERDECVRTPKKKTEDNEFRKLLFKNAPATKDDFIMMEKKHW